MTHYRRRSADRKKQMVKVTAWIMVIALGVTALATVLAAQLR